jgi:hypothetical protein
VLEAFKSGAICLQAKRTIRTKIISQGVTDIFKTAVEIKIPIAK